MENICSPKQPSERSIVHCCFCEHFIFTHVLNAEEGYFILVSKFLICFSYLIF